MQLMKLALSVSGFEPLLRLIGHPPQPHPTLLRYLHH